MAFTEIQLKEITISMDSYLANARPPEHIRHQLDIGWRYENQSVYLYEIRPQWNNKSIIRQYDYAKATWIKSKQLWQIFWQRANLKWDGYDPLPFVDNLQKFINEVEDDPNHCFRG